MVGAASASLFPFFSFSLFPFSAFLPVLAILPLSFLTPLTNEKMAFGRRSASPDFVPVPSLDVQRLTHVCLHSLFGSCGGA